MDAFAKVLGISTIGYCLHLNRHGKRISVAHLSRKKDSFTPDELFFLFSNVFMGRILTHFTIHIHLPLSSQSIVVWKFDTILTYIAGFTTSVDTYITCVFCWLITKYQLYIDCIVVIS